jgi:hypothetical protein
VRDVRLARTVALKVLDADADVAGRRFVREMQITATLEHPSIVPLYDAGVREDGRPYYTMKCVEGATLRDALNDCADLDARLRLLSSFEMICSAMAYAHERGVVHRDLKPGNIVVGTFGQTYVVDWGLAKLVSSVDAEDSVGSSPVGSPDLTRAGAVMGSPRYMSPEQAMGQLDRLGPASDVFSLGAILFELVAGRAAFPGGDAVSVVGAVARCEHDALVDLAPEAPPGLVAVVERCMRPAVHERYADAGAVLADLVAFRQGRLVGAYSYTARELVGHLLRRAWRQVLVAAMVSTALVAAASLAAYTNHAANGRTERALATAYVDRALAHHGAGDRVLASYYAALALQLREDHQARGVLAAQIDGLEDRLVAFHAVERGCTSFAEADWGVLCSGQGGVTALAPDLRTVLWARDGRAHAISAGAGRALVVDDAGAQVLDPVRGELVWADAPHARFAALSPNGQQLWFQTGSGVENAVSVVDLTAGTTTQLACGGSRASGGLWGRQSDEVVVTCLPGLVRYQRTEAGVWQPVGELIRFALDLAWDDLGGLVVLHTQGLERWHGDELTPIAAVPASEVGFVDGTLWLRGRDARLLRQTHLRWESLAGAAEGQVATVGGLLSIGGAAGLQQWQPSAHVDAAILTTTEGIGALAARSPWIVAGNGAGLVDVWHEVTGQHLASLGWTSHVLKGLAFSPDGTQLAAVRYGEGERQVCVYRTDGWGLSWCAEHPAGHALRRIAWAGEEVLAIGQGGLMRFREHTVQAHPLPERVYDLGAAGPWAVVSAKAHLAWINLPDGQVQQMAIADVGSVAVRPDGLLAFFVSPDEVRVVNLVEPDRALATFEVDSPVRTLRWSPGGRRLLGGLRDGRALVWDVQEERLVATLVGHDDMVAGVAFGSERRAVTGSWDRSVRQWDFGALDADPAAWVATLEERYGLRLDAAGALVARPVTRPMVADGGG